MSMLGIFGLCSQESFNKLAAAGGQAEAAEICREMEVSGQELENSSCSGEVFVALFQYLKAAFDVDVRKNAAPLGTGWRSLRRFLPKQRRRCCCRLQISWTKRG